MVMVLGSPKAATSPKTPAISRARDGAKPRGFSGIRRAETQFARQLRKVARHVGEVINGFPPGDPASLPALQIALGKYADLIGPWARLQAEKMIDEVSHRDAKAWAETAQQMSRALRQELQNAPTGAMLRDFLSEQVTLIKSLPIEAAQRVHHLTMEGLTSSARADEIATEIMRSGEVTKSRANLIARTEVARTASGLTMARAQHIGSTHYVWRTAEDSDVRPSHKGMAGKVVAWADPPTLDGITAHAGMSPNCRCYVEPLLPEEL